MKRIEPGTGCPSRWSCVPGRRIRRGRALLVTLCTCLWVRAQPGPELVTISSPSPLIQIVVMVRAGSAHDPRGREGLAYLTAKTLLEGGFGDPDDPVTKERLALMTRPWGEASKPSVRVDKEATTFYVTVPEQVLEVYLKTVLRPLFSQPLFRNEELERLRNEILEEITGSLRYEDIEELGLQAIEAFIFDGTSYAHLPQGTVRGLRNIGRQDLLSFYGSLYRPSNLIIGLSRDDPDLQEKVRQALEMAPRAEGSPQLQVRSPEAPRSFEGRQVAILSQPNADSSGIHAAFPLPLTRRNADFWPLWVANVFFGSHRDSFSHLFREIRQKRGYNYGDYSYVEHFASRPANLFPPFNTPRRHHYFSIWIRPVAHRYVHHLMKALTWELEYFVRTGMSDAQVELAKNKAKSLYLNLAETASRLLRARVDDAFYGMSERGYLDYYLERIESVTSDQVNTAIRRYLQSEDLKYVVVTDDEVAPELAGALAADGMAEGKTLEEYRIEATRRGDVTLYSIPEDQLKIIQRDAVWAAYPLHIPAAGIHLMPVEQVFVHGAFLIRRSVDY